MNGSLSLSGVEIDGNNLVRFVFMDESGISAKERFLVVAGVIVNADIQWKPVQDCLEALIEKYVAEEDRTGFVFEAKHLFHGTGKVFSQREKYPLSVRCEALKEILSIPGKFMLPVTFGFIRKPPKDHEETKKETLENLGLDHGFAFTQCAAAVERFMRGHAPAFEIATIVAEDQKDTKNWINVMVEILRNPSPRFSQWMADRSIKMGLESGFLPIRKIIHSVHFAEKSAASLLQVADVCAFLIRSYLEERRDIDDFITAFVPSRDRLTPIEAVRKCFGGRDEIKCWP